MEHETWNKLFGLEQTWKKCLIPDGWKSVKYESMHVTNMEEDKKSSISVTVGSSGVVAAAINTTTSTAASMFGGLLKWLQTPVEAPKQPTSVENYL